MVSNVEGEPRRKQRGPERGTQCLNCGLAIDTNYCPNCGQHNTSHNHGLGQFFHEFLEEFLHYDSKIIRTLVPLVRYPGKLTQEWIAGKRVRYITPLKLYVTLSAICFLAFSLKGMLYGQEKSDIKLSVSPPNSRTVRPENEGFVGNLFRKKFGTADQIDVEGVKDKFVSRLPTTNFILMPIVAGLFHLLYIRRKRFYVEHLVFTLHYYSFAFLVLTAQALLPPHFLVSKILAGSAFIWVIAYLPIAMVRNYQQGYFKTFIKIGIFGAAYAVVLSIALFGTFVVTALAMPDRQVAPNTSSPTINAPKK